MRPTHGYNKGEDTALCGAPIGGKKTRKTDRLDHTHVTCINCLRVLDGEARQATRKAASQERMRGDRIAWIAKALDKAARIAKDVDGAADVMAAIDTAKAKLDKLS